VPAANDVLSAGVVAFRPGKKVLLVHRPKYDDWSFPKGKLEPGETDEECALREVEEETGLRCELEAELPEARYEDRHGRPKRVRYWTMRPLDGSFAPNDEVDAIDWLPVPDAAARLTYPRDQAVLRACAPVRTHPPTKDQRHYRT
jgi:8-oxo-dGTP pyrophosphatase MutT (NUDIX family)